jgi:hypothetical protein
VATKLTAVLSNLIQGGSEGTTRICLALL